MNHIYIYLPQRIFNLQLIAHTNKNLQRLFHIFLKVNINFHFMIDRQTIQGLKEDYD